MEKNPLVFGSGSSSMELERWKSPLSQVSRSIVYCSFTAGWELRPIKTPAHCQRGTKFIRLAYFRNIRLSSSTLERQVVLPYGPPTGTVLSHTHSSNDRQRSSWLRHAIAMTGTCRNLLNATSSTADWRILGSLLWRSSLNKLCGRPPQYAHAPCKLTFDFLTLKVVSECLWRQMLAR